MKALLSGAVHGLQLRWAGEFSCGVQKAFAKLLELYDKDPETAECANARQTGFQEFEQSLDAIKKSLTDKTQEDIADIKRLANSAQSATFATALSKFEVTLEMLKSASIVLWYPVVMISPCFV